MDQTIGESVQSTSNGFISTLANFFTVGAGTTTSPIIIVGGVHVWNPGCDRLSMYAPRAWVVQVLALSGQAEIHFFVILSRVIVVWLYFFFNLNLLQNDTILTSQCMHYIFCRGREFKLYYKSFLPVTKKKGRERGNELSAPEWKMDMQTCVLIHWRTGYKRTGMKDYFLNNFWLKI